jgi:predicted transcriptional regulator
MPSSTPSPLPRRERQILDVIYARGRATAAEVLEDLPDPPSYSAVRALLVKLERKGHVRHVQDGPRYVYEPVVPRQKAQRSALERLMRTFFEGSVSKTVAALLDRGAAELTAGELDELAQMIDRARKGGR